MDTEFKDINTIAIIFSYLVDEEVISSMNATKDMFDAGKKYFKLNIDTANLACRCGNLQLLLYLEENAYIT